MTDTDGRVLWRRGRTGVRRLADRLGFVGGSAWTEANVGTNAIGTCLVVGEPVHIRGPEHYVESHTRGAAPPRRCTTRGPARRSARSTSAARRTPVQRSVLALVGVSARLAEAEVRTEHAQALDRLRAYAAPVVARVGGRASPSTRPATSPPSPGSPPRTGWSSRPTSPPSRRWLPTLGAVTVEPLPGGWLVRLGAEHRGRHRPGARPARAPGAAGPHPQPRLGAPPQPPHAEILLALVGAPEGRTAAQLADDLFADPTRVVTVRAEMSRLRRTLGSLLEAQPYRIAPAVRASVLLPAEGTAIAGSSAPWCRRPESASAVEPGARRRTLR